VAGSILRQSLKAGATRIVAHEGDGIPHAEGTLGDKQRSSDGIDEPVSLGGIDLAPVLRHPGGKYMLGLARFRLRAE